MFTLSLSVVLIFIGFSLGDPICGPNQHFDCKVPCQATCQNRQFAHCSSDCVPDCYCLPDYMRDEDSKNCVLIEDCPRY
ncbi:hypothetical protein WA026_013132 [Henosepilachna vigintioctopunctata]|uniref:TIL domain-containing protein n=1 Tax=Henosepilachna vigintioctopunctata TaxID=420089 RepID=A0AAW1UCQ6_9CUCU